MIIMDIKNTCITRINPIVIKQYLPLLFFKFLKFCMCVVVKYPILIGFCIAMLKHEINNLKVKKNNSGREFKISVCSGLKRAVEVWEERLSWEHDLPGIM